MKIYPKYINTNNDWINMIPEHWEIWKLSHTFRLIGSGTTPKSDLDIYYNGTILWVTTGDLRENEIYDTPIKITEFALKDYPTLKSYPKDSILIAMYGATIGRLGILKREATVNQACCVFANSKNVMHKFLFYWLLCKKPTLISLSSGGGQPNINQEVLKKIKIPVPKIFEQEKIISFLDKKTSQIDNLITQKEKLIELLQEQKTAIINQVVTKGLNKDVKMKDSGIEWLDEIPEHWKLKKIKYTSYVKARVGWKGLTSTDFELNSDAYLITGTDFKGKEINWEYCYQVNNYWYENDPYIQLMENDLLITKDGTIGKIALVKNMPKKTTLNSGVFVVRPLKSFYLTEYMYWLLNSSIFDNFIKFIKTGSTINHLYQDVFENFQTPLPDIDEQLKIINYLETETNKINRTFTKIENEIELLHEYREALISEAVTGKIDVREFA